MGLFGFIYAILRRYSMTIPHCLRDNCTILVNLDYYLACHGVVIVYYRNDRIHVSMLYTLIRAMGVCYRGLYASG